MTTFTLRLIEGLFRMDKGKKRKGKISVLAPIIANKQKRGRGGVLASKSPFLPPVH